MTDQDVLDDLSRVNNELVNSQRELARLHAVAAAQNSQLEALHQTLMENAPQVIWSVEGASREMMFANRAWYELVGGKRGDWASCASRAALIHPDDREAINLGWQRSLQTLSTWTSVRRLLTKDGTYRVMSTRRAPVLEADGTARFWVGIETDITDLKDAEAALQQALAAQTRATQEAERANRAKSTFLAAMSHEIRTPMTGVLGLLELLGTGPLAAEQRASLEVAQESGRSLLRIVNDILDFSRIEANRLELDVRPCSIRTLAYRVAAVNAAAADVKGLVMETEISHEVSDLLQFDSVRVGQILNNLVGNAIKFTDKGKVKVCVEFDGRREGLEHLRFVVEDSGIGISPRDQQRIFAPFMQASSETATVSGGSGLGLMISRRLAELMGGTLEMRSVPGCGTTMTAHLAFAVATAEVGVPALGDGPATPPRVFPATPTVAEAQAEGCLLLVVDDHPTNRLVLQRMVQRLGYACELAENGRVALDAWKSGRFAAVLADCNMPVMDGYDMTRAIRLAEQASHRIRTPVIACTAGALATEEARCIEAGMDDYLVKPVSLATLGERLKRWLPLPPSRLRP